MLRKNVDQLSFLPHKTQVAWCFLFSAPHQKHLTMVKLHAPFIVTVTRHSTAV